MSREFGEHLRFMRTSRAELSQYEMARLLKIDRSTYSYYELGKTEPSIETLKQIAAILGVTVDRLVKWENNHFLNKSGSE